MPFVLKHTGQGEINLQDHPIPLIEEGQLLVKVEVVGGNEIDAKLNKIGPHVGTTVGYEFSGTVSKTLNGSRFRNGDRVAGFAFGHSSANAEWGTFAEYCVGWEYLTFHVPDGMSHEQAVTLPVALDVAGLVLERELKGVKGHLLVIGGATNMGATIIQYAKVIGISPIIAVAGKRSKEFVKNLGADHVIDYNLPEEDYIAAVKAVAPGIKTVIDTVANQTSHVLAGRIVGPGGRVLALQPPHVPLPEGVKYLGVNSFGSFGVAFNIFGHNIPADTATKEFLQDWFPNVAEKLVTEGKIKPHGYRMIDGGLLGVKEGWKMYGSGEISKEKLVYRVKDTPGI